MFQNMNNIVMVVGELAASRVAVEEQPVEAAEPAEAAQAAEAPEAEDDRVSVDEETTPAEPVIVSGPPAEAVDTDGLESKSKKELQDILTKKGIPFGKGDNKNALISLLKATA
jgi:hypothetical protein